jgi:hypothetical protein
MIYIFYNCSIEISAHVPRGRSKGKLRRRFKKATIYATSMSEPALPTKYSEYTDVFSEDKINNISPVARIEYVINFEKTSIIFYKSIYHLFKRELIILKQYLIESKEKN